MRFLVREKPFERLVAAGALRYLRDDEATGATERWRVTRTPGGDQIVRVDLDGRGSESKRSALYHYICSPEGAGQRLVYRLLHGGRPTIGGSVLFSDHHLLNSRRNYDADELPLLPLLFPSTFGLALLAGLVSGRQMIALLDIGEGGVLREIAVGVERLQPVTLTLNDEPQPAEPVRLKWADQQRTVWLHDGYPLLMRRQDGLEARQTHRFSYAD